MTDSAFILKLYVTGRTPRSARAIADLERLCSQELGGDYRVEVVDVLEQPQQAEDDKVIATPTVIRQLPPPVRRIVGDLSDREKVLLELDLRRRPTGAGTQFPTAAE